MPDGTLSQAADCTSPGDTDENAGLELHRLLTRLHLCLRWWLVHTLSEQKWRLIDSLEGVPTEMKTYRCVSFSYHRRHKSSPQLHVANADSSEEETIVTKHRVWVWSVMCFSKCYIILHHVQIRAPKPRTCRRVEGVWEYAVRDIPFLCMCVLINDLKLMNDGVCMLQLNAIMLMILCRFEH